MWLTLLEWLYAALKALGVWDRLLAVHEAHVKAQAVADSPVTAKEWSDDARHGEL